MHTYVQHEHMNETHQIPTVGTMSSNEGWNSKDWFWVVLVETLTITYRPQKRSATSKWRHADATVMVLENMRVIPGSCFPHQLKGNEVNNQIALSVRKKILFWINNIWCSSLPISTSEFQFDLNEKKRNNLIWWTSAKEHHLPRGEDTCSQTWDSAFPESTTDKEGRCTSRPKQHMADHFLRASSSVKLQKSK